MVELEYTRGLEPRAERIGGSTPSKGTSLGDKHVHQLYKPESLDDPIVSLIKDDPVRPEIPADFRLSNRSEIFVLMENSIPLAVLCAAYCDLIPKDVNELFKIPLEICAVIFYTIWSYAPGAGRELVFSAASKIKEEHPEVKRFVTLSPKTEMARKFHLKNGASILSENNESVNYEYSL